MVSFNKDISAIEKLHYLKSQVTGEAARYIANIPVTAEGLTRAWEALTDRYENRRVIVTTHLDRLFHIKPITQKSSSELKSALYGQGRFRSLVIIRITHKALGYFHRVLCYSTSGHEDSRNLGTRAGNVAGTRNLRST